MLGIAASIVSLLISTALVVLGAGLLSTLLGLRALLEQFSIDIIGYVMSAYFLGMFLGTYIVPHIVRRVGHIRTFAALAAVAASVNIAHLLLIDPVAWALFRLLTGIALVGLYMVLESWLNTLAPNDSRGRYFAAYMVVTFLALALSQFLLVGGKASEFDLFGVSTILITLALVPIALTRIEQPQLVESPSIHILEVYRQAPLGLTGTLTIGLIMGSVYGMLPIYGVKIGLDSNAVVLLMAATIMGGAILQWPLGMFSDRVDRRIVLTAVALGAAALAAMVFTIGAENVTLLYGVFFLFGGFSLSLYSLSVAHVNDSLDPQHALEAARTLMQVYGIGAFIGPVISGLLMDGIGSRYLPLQLSLFLLPLGLYGLYVMTTQRAVLSDEQATFIPVIRTSPVAMEMDPRANGDDNENAH